MKKHSLVIALWIMGLALLAQPVLEHSYSESAAQGELESIGEVYYAMDVVNKLCHIYNMDHSLYKTISLPTPEGYYLSDLQYISEKLFNDDNLVELVYTYSKYVPTTNSYYYTYETKLINENGTVILSHPGAGHTRVINTLDHGKKFLVYEYDYSVIPYRTYTHVYSLPEAATKSAYFIQSSPGLGNAYPNPAGGQVHIPVILPQGIHAGILELFDVNGQKVLSHPVTTSSSNVVLATHLLVPGTYLYHVDYGSMQSEAKKILIQNF